MANLYIGLVHYPIMNKHKDVITTAITNYDIHDIARASITYDVSKYFVIHNIPAQRELAATIMEHWKSGFGSTYNPDRKDAFTGVELVNSIAVAVRTIEELEGVKPIVATTDARTYDNTISYARMREHLENEGRPVLVLFGTGYGMTKETMEASMSGHSKWANIKHKKGKTDALKAKLATKIGREITVAARMGGADPTGNMRLKLALQKARENNIPKDNIQRAIDKGVGATDMNAYEEIVYEGYGPAGVAVTVEVMTDNRNRAAADVRHAFSKQGGNLGESGCVGWMFKSKGVFVIDKEGHDEDELTLLALDAGAEDLKAEDDVFEIYTTPEDFDAVEQALADAGIETEVAKITMIPDTTIELSGDDAVKMQKMLDVLDDLDDVQNVYHNGILPDDEEE